MLREGAATKFRNWSMEEKKTIRAGMYKIAGFPCVIGCVDGTHIRLQAPSQNEPNYVNRKKFHSINVQVICDDKRGKNI